MNKFIIPFFFLMAIIESCYPTKRAIKSSQHLFEDVNYIHPLNEQPLQLITRDHVYFLHKVTITDSGKIEATLARHYDKTKSIRIYTNQLSDQVVKKILDSTGNESDVIQFSEEHVHKIIYHKSQKGPNKEILYDKNFGVKSFFQVLFVLAALYLVGYIIYASYVLFVNVTTVQCFVATMVYGSVEAWEVVILRRYRDEKLATNFLGRTFIKWYYICSPGFVKLFGENVSVKLFVKFWLDRWINKLIRKYHWSDITNQLDQT